MTATSFAAEGLAAAGSVLGSSAAAVSTLKSRQQIPSDAVSLINQLRLIFHETPEMSRQEFYEDPR